MFHINAEALPLLEAFSYLGSKIVYNNSNWAAVYQNVRKSRRRWGMIVRVLENMGETVWSQGVMYKLVAQLVIMYRSEIWVVTG